MKLKITGNLTVELNQSTGSATFHYGDFECAAFPAPGQGSDWSVRAPGDDKDRHPVDILAAYRESAYCHAIFHVIEPAGIDEMWCAGVAAALAAIPLAKPLQEPPRQTAIPPLAPLKTIAQ